MSIANNVNPVQIAAEMAGRQRRKLLHIDNWTNPLPDQVKDSKQLREFFTTFPYIPYATQDAWTAHSLINLLFDLRSLSSTEGACIRSKQLFAFGGKISFKFAEDDIYDTGKESVYLKGPALDGAIEMMKQIEHIKYGNPKAMIQEAYSMFETTGDIWLEVALGQVGGEKAASIQLHHPYNCMYRVVPNEEYDPDVEIVGVCKDWNAYMSGLEPIRHIPKYPNWDTGEDGAYRTMIHVKYGDGDFYGRPPSEGALPSKYNEYQDAVYLIKIGKKNFTGQIIYEMEDDGSFEDLDKEAQRSGYRNFGDQLEKNATNEAEEPMTLIAHTRPMGARPSVLHQIKPNTSEAWYTETGNLHRTRIIIGHQWSERLMGISVANGFSSNVFLDEAHTKEFSVLRGLRAEILHPFNMAYNAIFQFFGNKDEIQLEFKSIVDEELERRGVNPWDEAKPEQNSAKAPQNSDKLAQTDPELPKTEESEENEQ